jgi:NADH-quinone oxidoreductase subunit A
MMSNYIPVFIFLVIAVGFASLLLVVAWALGPKRESAEKNIPYECGQDPASSPRARFSVGFYRVAILFLVFDIEAVFFYPWAILYRDLSCKGSLQAGICHGGATSFGLLVMVLFLSILVLALLYVWRKRALEWD